MSISVGTVPSDLPLRTNPPAELIVILERPLFKPAADGPNCSFFCWLESWEAAIKAKSALSPVTAPAPPMARWNWTGLPQSALLLGAIVQSVPVVEEPVTTQLPPE